MPDECSTDLLCLYCTRDTSMESVSVKDILVCNRVSTRGNPVESLVVVILYHLHIFDTSPRKCLHPMLLNTRSPGAMLSTERFEIELG